MGGKEGRTKISTARLSPKKDTGALIPQQRGYLNNDNIRFVNVCAYVSVLGEPQMAYPETKNYRYLKTDKRGGKFIFPREEYHIWASNTKWSAPKSYTQRQH